MPYKNVKNNADDHLNAEMRSLKKEKGPRPVSPAVVQKVLGLCKLGFRSPKGEIFVCDTPAAARSMRQAIYEVRRYLRGEQGKEQYRVLFESHIKLEENKLHIGPHPMTFNEGIFLKGPNGELIPISEALEPTFKPVETTNQDPEVHIPLTYMEKFQLAALIQQAIVEICKERGIDLTQMALAKIMPQAKKRGTKYFSEGITPDREIPEIEAFYDAYSAEYEFALFKQSQGE